jgi:lysophospholipase L1-like esterase
MTIKNIMCFGDSNTWGYNPVTGGRFLRNIRWTGILQKMLGNSYYVIEEGLNGRTTVLDDPAEGHMGDKNGVKVLPLLLSTNSPLDLVIVMLGTNDLKKRFSASPFEASLGIERIIDTVKRHNYTPVEQIPGILILSPPPITFLCNAFREHFRETAPEESRRFSEYYQQVAQRHECRCLDTASFAEVSPEDGIHLTEAAQEIFARKVYGKVLETFPTER